jgi:hypothetical protein
MASTRLDVADVENAARVAGDGHDASGGFNPPWLALAAPASFGGIKLPTLAGSDSGCRESFADGGRGALAGEAFDVWSNHNLCSVFGF